VIINARSSRLRKGFRGLPLLLLLLLLRLAPGVLSCWLRLLVSVVCGRREAMSGAAGGCCLLACCCCMLLLVLRSAAAIALPSNCVAA
jgi:hypothetical protein